MDGLGKAGSLGPGRAVGSAGDGQGAFENFLASAIATVITIIFSWRLLLETQETAGPLALEAAGQKEDKSKHSRHAQGHALNEQEGSGEITQVNIDQKSVSKVTSKNVSTPLLTADSRHDARVTGNGYKLTRASNHVNLTEKGNYHTGFDMTADFADSTNTWMNTPDQYLPAPAGKAAAGKDNKLTLNSNKHTSESNNEWQTNPEGILPRPSWAVEDRQTVTSTARIELSSAGLSPSDSSGEEDTETEEDCSSDSGSDSTLEFQDEFDDADDADLSESDNSLSNSVYSGADAREFFLVGDPLGDDDSESEYCVVFNSMLEAITEEDTDELSEIEREANDNRIRREKLKELETDQVDSFVISQVSNEHKTDHKLGNEIEHNRDEQQRRHNKQTEKNSDSDSAINNDRLSEAELTSDTNSIDVSIDTDAYEPTSSTSAVYGPIINTQRPLVIGPYRDRGSKFSQEQVIQRTDVRRTDVSPLHSEKDEKEQSTGDDALPQMPFHEGSFLERARSILAKPFGTENGSRDQSETESLPITSHSSLTDISRANDVSPVSEKVVHMDRRPIQSFTDKKIEDDRYDLDRSQGIGGRDLGERKEFNIYMSDDPPSLQAIQTGLDDRSSTNADSDLDSLTECFDQFKKVALNHLEHTTPSQASVDNKQSSSNEIDRDTDFDHNIESDNYPNIARYKGDNTENSMTSLSKSDSKDHKSLGDSEQPAQVFYGGSIDNLIGSDKLSTRFDDAPLSTVARDEQPAQSRKFVRTLNVERNYVLRNETWDKKSNENGNSIFDNKAIDGENMQGNIDHVASLSPYVSSSIGGLNSFDEENHTNGSTARDDLYSRSQFSTHGDYTHGDQKHNYYIEIDKERHRQPQGGPIAETTVGKFSVRPHPSYKELYFDGKFSSHQEPKPIDQDQPEATENMHNKGSSEVGFQPNKDITSDLTGRNKHVQPNNTNAYDQRKQEKDHWNVKPQENTRNQMTLDKFDPDYFQSMQPYSQNGHSTGAHSNPKQLANRKLYNVDDLADRETFDLSGNIVAYQDLMERRDTPCHVVATSSAMARRGDLTGMDPDLPPAGSAIASTEASSDNPYIAVARATARAATIASANAAAGAKTSGPEGSEPSGDISVMVSTSCTIKEGSQDSKDSVPKLAYPESRQSSEKRDIQLTPTQKKKMMITIEESQKDSDRREYRTLECEMPKHVDGDVTAMISEAVKRIIASQSSLAHQRGNQLNKAIDQITRQVVSAYKEPDSGYEEIPRYSVPPQRLALYDGPSVKSKAVPEFRAQKTPHMYHQQVPARPALPSGGHPARGPTTRPGAYLSRVINTPGDPDECVLFHEKDEKPVFYVKGRYPTADGEARATDDVVLKVVTDKDMRPSVEHVLLSESESDMETPLMERKHYKKMKEIKEEDNTPVTSTKKKKPARPKLLQPAMTKVDEYAYVSPEAWSECTGCEGQNDTNKGKSVDPAADKTVKSILKARPNSAVISGDVSNVAGGGVPKSKSSGYISSQNNSQSPSNPATSPNRYQPVTKPRSASSNIEKKPYQSILLTPVKDEKTIHTTEPLSPPLLSPTSIDKKFFFKDEKAKVEIPNDIPVAIPNTRPTRIDIEFEKRKRDWRARTPSPKGNVVMVDIDIDGSKGRKPRSKSVEDLKRKLSRAPLKAPSNDHVDKHWEGVSEKLSKSQEKLQNRGSRSRGDSFSSDTSQSFSMRRSTSMGTLSGQFFADKRSYTSLIETDLDTGVSTEIPLIQETNIDEFLTKSKSMTNLNTATNFRTYDIYSDDVKYKSSEMISNASSQSSEREPLNQVPIENNITERSRSAHELRISNSLNKLSLPPWFKANNPNAEKPVQLVNTKIPPRIQYELPPPDDRSKNRPKLDILPSKPIVINHRVSRSISKSPSSSTCSTPIGGPQVFELPSNKLRQSRETGLSPMPIKSPYEVPPLPPRNYREKETARDSYLRLKANSNPESWEPLSSRLNSPARSTAGSDQFQLEERTPNKQRQDPTEEEITTHRPRRQEEIYITQRFMNVNNSEDSSLASEPYAPRLPPRNYYESSDSGVASLEQQRYDSSGHSLENTSYSPGRTVSNLVRDLKIDTNQLSPLHDSGIDSASPDAAYNKMITTLEGERKDIKNKASEITSPHTPDTQSMMRQKGEKPPEINRNSFPVLSLNTSPGMKRRSFHSIESLKKAQEPEPSTVTMSFGRRSFRDEARNEANILDSRRKTNNSLDEVLGGLLAIPPPPGHPDDEGEFYDESEEEKETPKERNFKILKQATTPRGSNKSTTPGGDGERDQSDTEIDEDTVTVQCRNTKCGKSEVLSKARKSYKTCHNCFTYYCSRDCRKEHWERHKRKCLFSRINSGCKHIIKKIQNSDTIAEEMSKIARTGYLTKGRGCVMLVFSSPMEADKFLLKGFEACRENPSNYANIKDIQDEAGAFGEQEKELIMSCKSYNPELKYVLEVAIVTSDEEIPRWPIPRREGTVIKKCAKVRLHSTAASKQSKTEDPETLVLTAVPGSEFTENMAEKQAREICLVNIQRQLRQRGVSLRLQYPEVYRKLCAYVSDNEHFTPISLYPLDASTGKRFMCLIMPNSEPEVNWMYNPNLLGDLDLHTQV